MPKVCINRELAKLSASSAYGAQMGRRDIIENDAPQSVVLQRVRFVAGDYDAGGAYWGGGRGVPALWCAMSEAGDFRVFVRANTRAHAFALIVRDYPRASFAKPELRAWRLYWGPTAQHIATIRAQTGRAAIRKAPAPYRRFMGEIRAELDE